MVVRVSQGNWLDRIEWLVLDCLGGWSWVQRRRLRGEVVVLRLLMRRGLFSIGDNDISYRGHVNWNREGSVITTHLGEHSTIASNPNKG